MPTKAKRKPSKATARPRKGSGKTSRAAMRRPAKGADPYTSRVVFIPQTTAGVRVDEDIALQCAAVMACVRVIAETLASLAWHVLERTASGGKERATGNPVDWILHTQSNEEMSAGTFRETIVGHALLWGNGYAEIERDGAGRPFWMWPLPPDRMWAKRDDLGRLYYEYWPQYGPPVPYSPREIFHLKGLGFDGILGYPTVRMASQAIGLALAMESHGSAFFGNGSKPGGVLKYPGRITPEIMEETRKRWMQQHGGPKNANRVAVLDQGMEFVPTTHTNDSAQWTESRQLQVAEICRIFRVPPHKLAELSRATFSNIEHQSIEFVTDTILPWAKRLEQEADIKLFGRERQGRLFTKLNIDSLLRGDMATRFTSYQMMLDRGVFSINDVLDLEDRNGIGPDGDKRFVQANMQLLEKAGEEPLLGTAPVDSPMPGKQRDGEEGGDPMPKNRMNGHPVESN